MTMRYHKLIPGYADFRAQALTATREQNLDTIYNLFGRFNVTDTDDDEAIRREAIRQLYREFSTAGEPGAIPGLAVDAAAAMTFDE